MKKHKISFVILVLFLFGCSSVQPESVPTLTPIPTHPRPTIEIPKALPPTTLPESESLEITTTFTENQIIIKGFQSTFIRWLNWSKDGKTLLIGTQEHGIIIYDVVNKKVILNFENGMIIQNLALSPDEKILALVISSTDSIRLVNPETGNLIKTLYITRYWPGSLTFSPDSKVLVSANDRDGKIIVWDVSSGKEISQLFRGDYELGNLSFSPDGNLLMASSMDNSFRVWDTHTWKLQRTFGGGCCAFSFSPDGSKFATSSGGPYEKLHHGELAIWDFNTGKKLFNLSNSLPRTIAIAYNPSGEYIAVGGSNGGSTNIANTITIYNVNTGKYLRELAVGYYAQPMALAFSPDGTKLASVSQDEHTGEIIIWDINQP